MSVEWEAATSELTVGVENKWAASKIEIGNWKMGREVKCGKRVPGRARKHSYPIVVADRSLHIIT